MTSLRLAPITLAAVAALAACGAPAAPAARGLTAPARAAAPAPAPGPVLAIRGARVFDGERALGVATVVVRGDRIAAVGPDVAIPAGARVIDGAGKTLLPGLIDAHIHIWNADQLHQAAVFGVTTALDMLTVPATIAQIRASDRHDLADVRSAGFAATAPGGHGTEYGFAAPTLTTPAEAQAFVDARIAEGSDYIKIIEDDGSVYGIHLPTIDRATVAAVIAAAHRRGKLAVIHIATQADARAAVAAGVDGLAHIFTDTPPAPDFAAFVLAHHAFVCPTLSVNASVSGTPGGAALVDDPDLAPYLSPADVARLRQSFPHTPASHAEYANAAAAVRALAAAGVPLLAGTDAPNPGTTYGASLHGELARLVDAGLTPAQALVAATAAPAAAFHLGDRGRIRAGARADLLLVDGDPTADIRATRRIAGVWLAGVPVDRAAYRAERARERDAAAKAAANAAAQVGDGRISDFDDGTEHARFGAGWAPSTDALVGGASTVTLAVVPGGAHGTHALRVAGTVAAGAPHPWAGAMFYPGAQPMAPADLSARKSVAFAVRGDGKTYSVMLFSQGRGFRPAIQTFVAPRTWQVVRFPFAAFDGLDGHDLMGIAIVATTPGSFQLDLDDVRLE